jgi:hypothetical protein
MLYLKMSDFKQSGKRKPMWAKKERTVALGLAEESKTGTGTVRKRRLAKFAVSSDVTSLPSTNSSHAHSHRTIIDSYK